MAITTKAAKGSTLTASEMDSNLIELNNKDFKGNSNPSATDDSSKGFRVGHKWTNITTGDTFVCNNSTIGGAIWIPEVTISDIVRSNLDPQSSDTYDFIGQRWINKTSDANGEVINKIFIAAGAELGSVTWVQTYPVTSGGSSIGLEAIDEGSGVGLRLEGRDPANYGNIGLEAIDLSLSQYSSNTAGARGNSSLATGLNTEANATCSVAMGYASKAAGNSSFATGFQTEAYGDYSFATGFLAKAHATYSVSMGYDVLAGHDSQVVFGKYNYNKADTLFEIGDGADSNNRSNIIELYSNGALHIDKLVDRTVSRPTLTKASSVPFFDTDLGKPIWYNGSDWVDATGTTV